MRRLVLAFAALIVAAAPLPAAADGRLAGKIAFLRAGEVWLADQAGRGATRLTATGGKVEAFLVSPDLRYLAYHRLVGYREEPGLWEEGEEPPQRAVHAIAVLDLATRRVVREVPPPEDEWIRMDRWVPGGRLVFHAAGGFDVSGFFEYDVARGVKRELDYTKGSILATRTDFGRGGTTMVYVDEGLDLHLVDLATQVDRMLPARRGALAPALSPDGRRIAFVEVEWGSAVKRDRLWVYDLEEGPARELFSAPVRPKSGRGVAWSPDGRHVAMFYPPEAVVVSLASPSAVHRIRGAGFDWLDGDRIVFTQGKDVYVYRLDAGAREVLIRDAGQPQALR